MTRQKHSRIRRESRAGAITVLSAIMMASLFAMLAFSIDVAYLCLAREELQRTADSAALAGAWELIDEAALTGGQNYDPLVVNANSTATQFAGLNPVLRKNLTVGSQDITVGYLANPSDPTAQLDTSGTHAPNAVRVVTRRSSALNGEVPFFIAKLLGVNSAGAQAEATAVLATNFGGFRTPPGGGNLEILPFALDLDTWTDFENGIGTDNWSWDETQQQVSSGSDGILEFNLYPQGTGSPGNRGTIDIGSNNNSTNDIARQILYGITPDDLSYHGGSLVFDQNGELELNGDTGISAGVKDELADIKGQPRIIPIFSQVTGNGNNAMYTIVKFAGVRIVDVKLTGPMNNKRVIVQPCNIVAKGGVPSTGTSSSHFIYSPVWMAR